MGINTGLPDEQEARQDLLFPLAFMDALNIQDHVLFAQNPPIGDSGR